MIWLVIGIGILLILFIIGVICDSNSVEMDKKQRLANNRLIRTTFPGAFKPKPFPGLLPHLQARAHLSPERLVKWKKARKKWEDAENHLQNFDL